MARLLTVLALVFTLAVASAIAAAAVDEAAIKKMKVRQLKQFLEDRAVDCEGCEEKADFVRTALKHVNTPLHPSKVKSVPQGTLWEAWAKVASEVCESTATTKKAADDVKVKVCGDIKVATDSIFMQYGKRTANKLKKKPDALLKTSFGEIYQSAGKKMLGKLAAFCFKNKEKCSSSSKIQALMEKDNAVKGVKFIAYLTNVGIENTNPMYETMKDKSLNNDEL